MKKKLLSIFLISMSLSLKAQNTTFNNVSIGTDYPANGVQIRSNFPGTTSGWARSFHITNENGTRKFIELGAFGGTANGISSLSNAYIGTDWNSQYMTFLTNGNIGIGTTTPSDRLSVLGGISKLTISGTDGTFDNLIKYGHKSNLESGTNYANRWHGIDATITAGRPDNNKLKIKLYAGGTENKEPIDVMTLVGNGNVGIGTTNPTAKLTVAGDINSREVRVTVNAGADFVFENDYNLPSLTSVETFIKGNKHLPEIASAKEMQENGINLSEMNIKLLQKIEELTLYTIEQDKKNNTQSQEIEILKKENEGFKSLSERLSKLENQLK